MSDSYAAEYAAYLEDEMSADDKWDGRRKFYAYEPDMTNSTRLLAFMDCLLERRPYSHVPECRNRREKP